MKLNKLNILGVGISTVNKNSLLTQVNDFCKSNEQHFLVTPNPEIILASQSNEVLFNALINADIALPDGMGVKIASLFSGVNLKRITGADICPEILNLAEKNQFKVAILNWKDGLSSSNDIKAVINKKNPNLNFIVVDSPREWSLSDYEEINVFEPQILFITFGSPYQEIFIYKNLKKLPFIRFALAVGGSFDFLTGKARRAPIFFRFLGLEWLFRALSQGKGEKAFRKGKRIKRVLRAIIIFPLYFIRYKFIRPFLYRPNVACLMFKKDQGSVKFFTVERSDEPGHWQIPQGGLDGQSVITAGIRELTEESGTNKFRLIKIFKDVYKYRFEFKNNFDKGYRFGYKGQKQNLFIAEFLGKDGEINIQKHNHRAWRWVNCEKFIGSIHPVRKAAYMKYLDLFNKLNYTNEIKN